jgi:hypothetical protein
MIPVEGHKNLYRDEKTGAIISTDSFAYSQYMQMSQARLNQKQEIDEIRKDIDDIKSMLSEVIKKL